MKFFKKILTAMGARICRVCGRPIGDFDDICNNPGCGASNP